MLPTDLPFTLQLAKAYSYAHGWMHQGLSCGDMFPGGITNGASWYSLSKGKDKGDGFESKDLKCEREVENNQICIPVGYA